MQFDRTTIAIRERGLLDTLDLSLHVLRRYAGPVAISMALGVLPLMAVTYALLGWMPAMVEHDDEFPLRFVYHLCLQIFLLAPLASVFATAYLGAVVFEDRPRLRDVVRTVSGLSGRLLLCHLVLRGTGVGWLLLLALDRSSDFQWLLEGVGPVLLVLYSAGWRAFRPFINEIVLLERNPLTAHTKRVQTVGARSSILHGVNWAELLVRWVGAAQVGVPLMLAAYGCCLFVSGVVLNDWSQSWWMVEFLLPLSMWLVVTYLTVFRFLSYLDLRIRQEGWEVELRLRAEAARLRRREEG
jgi:hypothetical protein